MEMFLMAAVMSLLASRGVRRALRGRHAGGARRGVESGGAAGARGRSASSRRHRMPPRRREPSRSAEQQLVPVEALLLQIEQHIRLEQAAAESFLHTPTGQSLHSRTTSRLVN